MSEKNEIEKKSSICVMRHTIICCAYASVNRKKINPFFAFSLRYLIWMYAHEAKKETNEKMDEIMHKKWGTRKTQQIASSRD